MEAPPLRDWEISQASQTKLRGSVDYHEVQKNDVGYWPLGLDDTRDRRTRDRHGTTPRFAPHLALTWPGGVSHQPPRWAPPGASRLLDLRLPLSGPLFSVSSSFTPALTTLGRDHASHKRLCTWRWTCGAHQHLMLRPPSCCPRKWTSFSWEPACGNLVAASRQRHRQPASEDRACENSSASRGADCCATASGASTNLVNVLGLRSLRCLSDRPDGWNVLSA